MTQTEHPTPPRPLVGLTVRNFKKVRLVELAPDGSGVLQIRGRNAQGKSTVLDAFTALVAGGRVLPERPIHDGADAAAVVGTFGRGADQLIVERVWSDPDDPSTKLTVRRADGARYPRPQEVLDGLIANSADPVALMRERPQDLAQKALELVQVPLDLAAHASALEIAELRRRDAGRDVKQREGALSMLEAQAVGAPDAPVDTTALAEQLAQVTKAEAERAALVREVAQLDQAQADAAAAFARAQRTAEDALAALHKAEQEVRDAATRSGTAQHTLKLAQARLEDTPVPDGAAIRQQLAGAKDANAAYQKRRAAEQAGVELEAAKMAHGQAEGEVQRLRQQRLDALAGVTWPSAGLGYDPDTASLTLNGRPWTQASTAEQLVACADLAMAKPAAIQVLTVRAGNDLDAAHVQVLNDHVAARGWLMLLERVDDEPDGPGVWIEDGEVRGGDAARAPAAQEVA